MPVFRLPLPREAIPPTSPLSMRVRRTEPLRCLLWSLGGLTVGLISSLAPSAGDGILSAHLASLASPTVFWLRLFLSRLPLLLLLSLSGVTRMSGGITTAVLTVKGISDGLALAYLSSSAPSGMAGAYALWMLPDLAARLTVAISSRRLSRYAFREDEAAELPTRLLHHLTVTLAALCLSAIGAGLYTWMLSF